MGEGTKHYTPDGRKIKAPVIVTCIPITQNVMGEFFEHVWGELPLPEGRRIISRGHYPDISHQMLVERTYTAYPDFTHIWFIEHDHKFPLDIWARVQEWAASDLPIIGGMYVQRFEPFPLVGYHVDDEAGTVRPFTEREEVEMISKPDRYPVGVIGMGCTLVKREVFDAWPEGVPYFDAQNGVNGRRQTDDAFFCLTARQLGFKATLDSTCSVGHFATLAVGAEQRVAMLANLARARMALAETEERPKLEVGKPRLELVRA